MSRSGDPAAPGRGRMRPVYDEPEDAAGAPDPYGQRRDARPAHGGTVRPLPGRQAPAAPTNYAPQFDPYVDAAAEPVTSRRRSSFGTGFGTRASPPPEPPADHGYGSRYPQSLDQGFAASESGAAEPLPGWDDTHETTGWANETAHRGGHGTGRPASSRPPLRAAAEPQEFAPPRRAPAGYDRPPAGHGRPQHDDYDDQDYATGDHGYAQRGQHANRYDTFEDPILAEGEAGTGQDGDYDYPEAYEQEPAAKGRRGLIVIGALAAAIVIGGGLGLVYKSMIEGSSGEPPVITADSKPKKRIPVESGGTSFDSGSKSIYDRLPGNGEETAAVAEDNSQVVPREEPVIDRASSSVDSDVPGINLAEELSELASGAETTVGEATQKVAEAVDQTAELTLKPKKVKPVLVKPGEAISTGSDAIPEADAAPSLEGPALEAVATTKTKVKKAVATGTAVADASSAQLAEDVNSVLAGSADAIVAPATTTTKKKAAPQPEAADLTASVTPVAAPATSGGSAGYVVQVGVSTSRLEALSAFADMQQRYGSLLGAAQPDIQEIGAGKGFRLRLGPPASKQAANDLCQKLKTSGLKDCFIRGY